MILMTDHKKSARALTDTAAGTEQQAARNHEGSSSLARATMKRYACTFIQPAGKG